MGNLEDALFKSRQISLEEGALIASGAKDRNSLQSYTQKLSCLIEQIPLTQKEAGEYSLGRSLFDWLWLQKPRRFKSGGPFRLTEVINAHLTRNTDQVGNCLGLTLLFNVLAKRLGLTAEAVYLEDEFGDSPHVRSVVVINGSPIDVEHASPGGYDFEDKRPRFERIWWSGRELVADIYHSEGNLLFHEGKLEEAVAAYDNSLLLNPRYTKAYINAAATLLVLNRQEEAQAYLEKASLSSTS